jgi:hypothetical protein
VDQNNLLRWQQVPPELQAPVVANTDHIRILTHKIKPEIKTAVE